MDFVSLFWFWYLWFIGSENFVLFFKDVKENVGLMNFKN